MQLEIGQVYEGIVTGITQYGAFVEVRPTESERVTGMVHISEIANTFVRDIHEFLHESDMVRVRMIGVNPQGGAVAEGALRFPGHGSAGIVIADGLDGTGDIANLPVGLNVRTALQAAFSLADAVDQQLHLRQVG